MSTNFPTGLDSLTNPTPLDYLDSPSHSGQHANANDAIEALQAKVGIDSSVVTTSHDYQINNNNGANQLVRLDGDGKLPAGIGGSGDFLVTQIFS